jgi:hypothetical protein
MKFKSLGGTEGKGLRTSKTACRNDLQAVFFSERQSLQSLAGEPQPVKTTAHGKNLKKGNTKHYVYRFNPCCSSDCKHR